MNCVTIRHKYGGKIKNSTKNIKTILNQMYCKGTLLSEPVKVLTSISDNCNNLNIQGVPGGMCQTSGGCSLC